MEDAHSSIINHKPGINFSACAKKNPHKNLGVVSNSTFNSFGEKTWTKFDNKNHVPWQNLLHVSLLEHASFFVDFFVVFVLSVFVFLLLFSSQYQ